MNTRISTLTEIPEDLYDSLHGFLKTHPNWDQDRIFTASLSLFLLQNGSQDRRTSQIYLDTIFKPAA